MATISQTQAKAPAESSSSQKEPKGTDGAENHQGDKPPGADRHDFRNQFDNNESQEDGSALRQFDVENSEIFDPMIHVRQQSSA
jgi:hypothetical protein